ncbi:MAG TPA: aminotransferase class IV [Planctomycetota bacterium]|nr:aminotransferase class IV [Planctomycetota bacterium]
MPEIAFLNGKWMKPEQALVPAEDRGYNFGDGLYEVVVSYDGRIWALERHLLRLRDGIRALELEGADIREVREVMIEGLERSEMSDACIYVQLTRGVAPRKHEWSEGLVPSLFVVVRPRPVPEEGFYEQGVSVVTTPEIRWGRCDIKSINLLPNCLARQRARQAGAYDAVFVHNDGVVTEGSASSLFIVRAGTLITRESGPHILPGITQQLIIETARRLNVSVDRRPFIDDEMKSADEVFLTVSTLGVVAVVQVDGVRVADGHPGKMTQALSAAYWKRRDDGDDALGP